jgi:hypothetical protein
MRLCLSVVLVGLILVLTVPLYAHHSASSFWHTDRTVSIEGTVKSVKIVNPHPELVVEVTEPNGEKADWYISFSGNASAWIRAGWTDDTLPIGMKVKVEGNPSLREGAKALLSGREDISNPDGSVISGFASTN